MKKHTLLFLRIALPFVLLVVSCQKENKTTDTPSVKPEKEWTSAEINAFIVKSIKDNSKVFDWATASDDMLYAALKNTDNMLAVGFKKEGATDDDAVQFNATKDADWKMAKETLVKLIVESEQKANPSVDYSKFEMGNDFDNLNAFYVKVYGFETIQKLRKSPLVRYIYPSGFAPQDDAVSNRSDSGCDGYVGESLVLNTDYTQITPNAKQSWTYAQPQIAQAWARTTGAGIGVMVVDAGVSSAQTMYQLTNFRDGASSKSRTVSLLSRYPSSVNFWGTKILAYDPSPYSSCGHGTAMTGIVASPRSSLGTSVGVAYDCNLISVRAVEDVVISNSYEELGVASALNLAATTASVKVVSMSLGSITTRSVIGDAIKAIRNAGKLPFCAAGTSLTWTSWWGVIYPANMTEAIAVTGVDNNGSTCDVCHDGSEVDYVAMMDRASDGKSVLTLAVSGYQPATVGGSSAATATTAGIAALIWARNSAQTSAQVLNRLTISGSKYPTKSSTHGWGIVNANAATNF
ncbi:MAG: S8 family serine peptidase [Saprospiraceae bacterium]|nr:S8 family serine peptidase [Saprospiraceae bacterium]